MAKVYGGIKSMLDKAAAKKFKDSTNDCEESKEDPSVSLGQGGGQTSTEQKKTELKDQLGEKIFEHYYQLIYQHRANPASDEGKFRQRLKQQVGTNRELNKLIFDLEQVVFK